MAMNSMEPMMQFMTPLPTFRKMLASTWDENNYMHFFEPHSSLVSTILTLTKIVITNPTQANLIPDLAQLKDLPPSMRLKARKGAITTSTPLIIAIKVFGCLYKHANVFLHNCAKAIWSLKGQKDLHLSISVTFLLQKVSITLQRMQASSILT
jgi:hypothetical protein